jgi:hypothetical protein
MRFLRPVYLQLVGNNIGRVPTTAEFSTAFELLNYKDQDFSSGNFREGAGGEADFFKLLTQKITIQDLQRQI